MNSSHSCSSLSTRSETPSSILPDDSSSIAESESFKASSSMVGVAEEDWVASDISVGEEEQASLNSCKILCDWSYWWPSDSFFHWTSAHWECQKEKEDGHVQTMWQNFCSNSISAQLSLLLHFRWLCSDCLRLQSSCALFRIVHKMNVNIHVPILASKLIVTLQPGASKSTTITPLCFTQLPLFTPTSCFHGRC